MCLTHSLTAALATSIGLASAHLGQHFDFHDPTEDARATMLLYLRKNPYKERIDFGDAPLNPADKEKDFPAL